MKLIENNKVGLFDNVVIDTESIKYQSIQQKKAKKEGEKIPGVISSADFDPDAREQEYSDFLERKHLAVLKNIPEIFYKEYQDTAKDLNIQVKDYLNKVANRFPNDNLLGELARGAGLEDSEGGEKKPSKISTFFYNLKAKLTGEELRTLDQILQCFNDIKLELGKESVYISRIHGLLKKLSNAEKTGQEALKEKIFDQMIIDKYESILYASGFTRVITEEQLLKVGEKLKNLKKRNLELTYIKNYVKLIPDEIIEIKLKADLLEIFDNYVVLHYGDKTSVELTTKEKNRVEEIRRDPILFGVINGSRKLYYIGDWIDEDDDLTWKDLEENLKGEELELPEEIKIRL